MTDMQENVALRCDVCVVGAGIAGLNAVHVASQYLRPDQRIVLVDRKPRVGGMWVDTYDFVRLHQPHPFFTAGNVPWTLGARPEHLATKPEVLGHLRHCVDEANRRVPVTELLGHELAHVEEAPDGVVITCRPADGSAVTVYADRLVDARGLDIVPLVPFALSSGRVHSVSPEGCDLHTGPIAEDDAPVWVVGSGKTGMDTAFTLINRYPGREINLVGGTGTFFVNRDLLYPTGASRWWRGTRPNKVFAEMADRFDGSNEDEVLDWCRDTYGTWATPHARHFFFGMLSPGEADGIRNGLTHVVMAHLEDVVDESTSTTMRLDSGELVPVEPGSWIVNCTSHFNYREDRPTLPYVSPGGRIARIGATTMFGFTSFAGYFLTHLLMLDKIREVPLYDIDSNLMLREAPTVLIASAATMIQYNLGLVFDAVPAKVFQQMGLDFDRWYPLPRRLVGQLEFMASHKRKREGYRRALDAIAQRFGVRCGPVLGRSTLAA